jgi:DNA polymerase I-like protein with 3'-5' exonuclease and polymerase domains
VREPAVHDRSDYGPQSESGITNGDCDRRARNHGERKLVGRKIKRYKDIVGEGQRLLDVPFNESLEHACADADMTLRLYYRLQEELEKPTRKVHFADLMSHVPWAA